MVRLDYVIYGYVMLNQVNLGYVTLVKVALVYIKKNVLMESGT